MTTRLNLALAYLALAALLVMGLAGCAASTPAVITREVRVPVAIRCTPEIAPDPTYVGDLTPLDGTVFDLTRALLIEREQRKIRELELKTALEGCR